MKTDKTLFPALGMYILLLLSCFSRNMPQCGGNHRVYSISIGQSNMVRVNYFLDTGFLDISRSLQNERLVPDKINRYANNADTITLSWFYNYGYYADTLMREVLEKRLVEKLGKKFKADIEFVDFEEFTGCVASYEYLGKHEIMAYGSDIFYRVYLLAEFSSPTNHSGRGQMDCLLNSLHFR